MRAGEGDGRWNGLGRPETFFSRKLRKFGETKKLVL
jgi:hypothetical protein